MMHWMDVNEDFMNIHAFQKLLIRIKTNIKLRSHNGCLSSNECSNSTKIDTMIWINCYLSTTQKHWSVIKAQLVLKTISNNYSLRIQPTFACSKVNQLPMVSWGIEVMFKANTTIRYMMHNTLLYIIKLLLKFKNILCVYAE